MTNLVIKIVINSLSFRLQTILVSIYFFWWKRIRRQNLNWWSISILDVYDSKSNSECRLLSYMIYDDCRLNICLRKRRSCRSKRTMFLPKMQQHPTATWHLAFIQFRTESWDWNNMRHNILLRVHITSCSLLD